MDNFGFVFPGQGSQKLGMLSELSKSKNTVEQTFAEASEALGQDLWLIAQSDPQNSLDRTDITQPVLLTASVAIWRIWAEMDGKQPSLLAGHSLGEYSALVCAGVLELGEAVKVVHQRGQFMQAAVPDGTGKMAAIVGLEGYQINEICDEAEQGEVVSAANFNCPGQTVIAGHAAAVDRAIALCKEAGAKRALPLKVSVPSHCELMRPAAQQLGEVLDGLSLRAPAIPVLQNVNAEASDDPEEIKKNLIKQLYAPVLWLDCVQAMHKQGVRLVIECGPGRVLCGLIKRIEADLVCCGSDDLHGLESARQEVLS